MVAGAGFGKTTALAQAIRANDAAPRGFDVWVSCEAGDEDDERLATTVAGATPRTDALEEPVARVLTALNRFAPMDVCLVLDDIHELPPGSPGERLLVVLLRSLPAHAHVVLSSRASPSVPLARLRAAQGVVDIGESDLSFRSEEVETLARRHHVRSSSLSEFAGWPSLVQLALSARAGAAPQFLWEEIVANLSPPERAGLLALSTLGWGSPRDIERVAGCPVDLDRLVQVVPLLRQQADDRYEVHQLWETAAARIFAPTELLEVRDRALELLHARGETLRLGAAALRWSDVDALCAAALSLVRDSFGALPVATAERWLESAPLLAIDRPELALLSIALRQARGQDTADIDDEIDAVIRRFAAAHEDLAQAVAVALAAVIAFYRGDYGRLFALLRAVAPTPDAEAPGLVPFLIGAIDAALASLRGDPEAALRSIDALSFEEVPVRISELVVRLRSTMLVLVGRADEAARHSEQLLASHDPFVRWWPRFIQWQTGEPAVATGGFPEAETVTEINERDRLILRSHMAIVAAGTGDLSGVSSFRSELETMASRDDVRDATIGTLAVASCQIAEHDEEAAAATISAHVAKHTLDNTLLTLHLRRHISISYVLHDQARAMWEQADLGPTLVRVRHIARLLVAARTRALQQDEDLVSAKDLITSLPLVWSVELVVRAHGDGNVNARALMCALADIVPTAVRIELERLVGIAESPLREAAAELLDEVGDLSRPVIQLDVLGPLRLSIATTVLNPPDLRRGRVRTVLALLTLRDSIDRDQLIELMWPDADPVAARRNLRVTLSRVRRVLNACGQPNTATSLLRADGERISLAGPPLVDTDLWQLRRLADESDLHRRSGDTGAVDDCLQRAFSLWRAAPLTDLDAVVGVEIDLATIRRELIDVGLTLGELSLMAGRFERALHCAEKCRAQSPFEERAHRLAIAAQLHRRDHDGLRSAVDALRAALDDLGVKPDASTEMLLRRAQEQLTGESALSSGRRPR
jgi:ATP/maltotriose-dependent transcriptional regulator MalT/DNA-binding SARP family transcriptional activator